MLPVVFWPQLTTHNLDQGRNQLARPPQGAGAGRRARSAAASSEAPSSAAVAAAACCCADLEEEGGGGRGPEERSVLKEQRLLWRILIVGCARRVSWW